MKAMKPLTELAIATVLFASTLFAAEKGAFQVYTPIEVQGKEFPAGEYQLRWSGAGPNVDVDIVKNGKVLATVPATLSNVPAPGTYNSAVLQNNPDGSKSLVRVVLAHKKLAIDMAGQSAKLDNKDDSKNRN